MVIKMSNNWKTFHRLIKRNYYLFYTPLQTYQMFIIYSPLINYMPFIKSAILQGLYFSAIQTVGVEG